MTSAAQVIQQNIETTYDKPDQLKRIEELLIPSEALYAVYDCKGVGTGFVGVTDRRLIFYDKSLVFQWKSMVSIPYQQIVAVASSDEGLLVQTGKLALITAAGKFEFEFWGADKAHWVYRFIMNQILTQTHPQLPG